MEHNEQAVPCILTRTRWFLRAFLADISLYQLGSKASNWVDLHILLYAYSELQLLMMAVRTLRSQSTRSMKIAAITSEGETSNHDVFRPCLRNSSDG
jgi:hypothetical protein